MRKLFLIFILGILFVFPFSVSAQKGVTLYTVDVQLWPEYDQPSMLVIVDFKVAPMTPLPVDLIFHIPTDANLIAVAYQTENGDLLNANFTTPINDDDEQSFTISVEHNVTYRFEYYQSLAFSGDQRTFSYLWNNSYAVKNFSVSVLEPLDTQSFTTDPMYVSIEQLNELNFYKGKILKLTAGQDYTFNLQYEKSTDTLVNLPQGIQPADPIDENTPGRVLISNSYPYLIGILGVAMILGGFVYYWRTGQVILKPSRRRRVLTIEEDGAKTGAYCPHCGSRAVPGDKFCRTCGSRLRKSEE